jgi:flagellar FliJ protein
MATSSALETLIDLAMRETDEAAKRLGLAIRATEDTEKKLALLMQYRDEYAARFQANMARGLTAMGYRNFQLFMDKLDDAIAGQQQIVLQSKQRVQVEQTAWQQSERKRVSYNTLATRAQKEEQRKESKREQKMTDEQATRSAHYKR